MFKKIFATLMSLTLVCSSISVVSFAETAANAPTVIRSYVENFDSLHDDSFNTASENHIYKNINGCWYPDGDAGDYHYRDVGRHYHLNNDWIIRDTDGGTLMLDKFTVASGANGKDNADKAMKWVPHSMDTSYMIKNGFLNQPVDVSNGNAVGLSFDWFTNAPAIGQYTYRGATPFYGYIYANVVRNNGTDTKTEDILLAKIYSNEVVNSNSEVVYNSAPDTWNNFVLYLSEDAIRFKASADDATESNVAITDGYKITTVNSVFMLMDRNGGNNSSYASFGWDNLEASVLSAMPSLITPRQTPYFADFSGYNSTNNNGAEGVYLQFKGIEDWEAFSPTVVNYQLSETTNAPISVNVVNDKGELKTADKGTADNYSGYLKIDNGASDVIGGSPLCYIRVAGGTIDNPIDKPELGDKVQYSYDFKISGNELADSTTSLLHLQANLATGAGGVVSVAADGTVFDSEAPATPLAKLKADTWYCVDTLYSLEADGTKATVYLNGKKILSKVLTGTPSNPANNYGIDYEMRHTYSSVADADNAKYLVNSACFDNLCYQIFRDGENAFDFDKSASASSNKAIANADVDFVAGTIFPVAQDFTVADFKDLGLANATVLEADKETEAADADVLAGKVIKFTGDYGKDVYYTVSSEGGANVTKDSFVTVRENLGASVATSAKAGSLLTAKAVKGDENLEVYIAEYNSGELVGLTIGNSVANYNPKAAGNEIKVFIWNNGTIVPAFAGLANSISVN